MISDTTNKYNISLGILFIFNLFDIRCTNFTDFFVVSFLPKSSRTGYSVYTLLEFYSDEPDDEKRYRTRLSQGSNNKLSKIGTGHVAW